MINNRLKWLDSLKGLGILFVVLGHCFPPEQALTNYLYSFHIALFFFISGYLLTTNLSREKFSTYFAKRFKRLMLPYFGYGLFTYLVWLFIGRNFGVNKQLNVAPLKPLFGLLYGNGFNNYLVFNIAIWFLPALFSTLLIYFLLRKIFKNKIALSVAVLVLLVVGFIDSISCTVRLPWGFNISLIALFFVHFGHQGKVIIEKFEFNNQYAIFILGVLLVIAGYFLQSIDSGVSFNSHSYGNIFYFILSAVSSIIGYTILTKNLLDNKVLQFLGVNSLRILALHILSFSVISATLRYLFNVDYLIFKSSLVGRFTYFGGSIIIVSLYSIVIDRFREMFKG